MPTTTNEGISFPAGSAGVPPDVRGDLESLATTADTAIHSARSTANQGGLDTGWSLAQATLQTGWDTKTDPAGNTSGTLVGGVRKIGSEVEVSIRVSRNGTTISGGSDGNFSDSPCLLLASGYRPASPRYCQFVIPGSAGGWGRVDPSGIINLTNIQPGGSIANNTVIQIDAKFFVG